MSVTIDGKDYTWNAPVCVACWNERNPDRPAEPRRGWEGYVSGEVERCVHCGGGTVSGIYVRADPREVAFPKLDLEDEAPTLALPVSPALRKEIDG